MKCQFLFDLAPLCFIHILMLNQQISYWFKILLLTYLCLQNLVDSITFENQTMSPAHHMDYEFPIPSPKYSQLDQLVHFHEKGHKKNRSDWFKNS